MAIREYKTDVAIIGAGAAGIAGGIEALDAGAKCIAFEKREEAAVRRQSRVAGAVL